MTLAGIECKESLQRGVRSSIAPLVAVIEHLSESN